MEALRQEQFTQLPLLRVRLKQLGASYKPKSSTESMHVYWSQRTRQWLGVTVNPRGGYMLGYYAGCPCQS